MGRLVRTTPAKDGPGEIDLPPGVGGRGAPALGIYEFREGRLVVCLGADTDRAVPPPHARPKEFRTADGGPAVLWEFERETIAWGKEAEGTKLGLATSPVAPRL